MNTTTQDHDVGSRFAPVTPEEAAAQSRATLSREPLFDLIKPGVRQIRLEEGDNWLRFLNPDGKEWYLDFNIYEMYQAGRRARVIDPKVFGEIDLLRAVQVALYTDPNTRPFMRSRENEKGFRFNEQRKAILVAARLEGSTLGPFGIVQITLGKLPWRKEMKYKEAWGDALLKLPTIEDIDPISPREPNTPPQYLYGAIYDVVAGRLIKCSMSNVGKMEISATFTPSRTLPLGEWRTLQGQAHFSPKPEFADILRDAPNLRRSLRPITVDQQKDLIRTFVPENLWPTAEHAIQQALTPKGGNGAATASSGIPVPQEDPTEIRESDRLFLAFVKELGPKYRDVGESAVRSLIQRALVNEINLKQMATFAPEMLKSLACVS